MRATSPPGSTIAARLVAVQATIEQFCENGVTGTTVTLSGCILLFRSGRRRPSYGEPVFLCEGLQRCFRPGAEMLDHLGRRNRAEPGATAVVLSAREAGEEAGREQIAGAGCVHQLLDRCGG